MVIGYIAKGFDGSACLSKFIAANKITNPLDLSFTMQLNQQIKQQGNTAYMIFNIPYLISYLSSIFTLHSGDIIYTGTPAGVGKLNKCDKIQLDLQDNLLRANFEVSNT